MNTIEQIRKAVTAHEAARVRSDNGRIVLSQGKPTGFNRQQDSAMQFLAAVLPVLDAAAAWELMTSDTDMDESIMICDTLSATITKLLKDV